MILDRVPGREFVHAIAAEDWWACWNMHLRGTLFSIDFVNEAEPAGRSVREFSIDQLRDGSFETDALSPRMILLLQAAIVRREGWIGQGVHPAPTRTFSAEEGQRVIRRADRELRLEIVRRVLAPQAPSRIACLYLAEATPLGRTMVSGLKRHDSFTMTVEVTTLMRWARLDPAWLEGDELGHEQIAGYWSGEPRGKRPTWEFLLDGAISCTDEEELTRLKEWAVEAMRRADGTQGPIGSPQAPSRAVTFGSPR